MLKIYKNNKRINLCHLDSSLVILKHLSGWKNFIRSCGGNRSYPHNSHDIVCSASCFLLIIFNVVSIAFFYYFPFKFIRLLFLADGDAACIMLPIKYANQYTIIICIPFIVGVFSLINHWQFSFGAFGYYFESYFFQAFLIGGLLAFYRRCWNKLTWKGLDKIILDYYTEHNLDLDTQTKIINTWLNNRTFISFEKAVNTIEQKLNK